MRSNPGDATGGSLVSFSKELGGNTDSPNEQRIKNMTHGLHMLITRLLRPKVCAPTETSVIHHSTSHLNRVQRILELPKSRPTTLRALFSERPDTDNDVGDIRIRRICGSSDTFDLDYGL
jgi:hypothetical protein